MFEEVSDARGLDYIYPGNDFQMAGGGLMVIDVNNDGWEDFYQSGGVFDSKLWINNEGEFYDGTAEYGLDVLNGYFIQGAVCADYDNDGYQDFFIVNFGVGMGQGDKRSPVLLHNVKGERFEAIRMDGILEPGDYASACWGDFNNDGYVDLYIANYVKSMGSVLDSNGVEIGYDPTCYENKLLLNLGIKGFKECAADYGLNDGGCGLAVSFTDIDGDNDQDLLLLNDFGEWTGDGNRCYRNNYPESSFTDISDEVGFNHQMYGMGIGQGDYDEDGDLDYYITNIGQNYLLNNENGMFSDVAEQLNVAIPYVYRNVVGTSWSGLFFDAEFDGDLDLYVSKGNVATLVPKAAISDRNKLFINESGNFLDTTSASGVGDIVSHRGAIIFDYDHDGDLDIISSVVKLPWAAFAKKEQKIRLYENKMKAGNWIGIRLVGEKEVNRDCFGCSATLIQGDEMMIREVDGGSGQASQSTRTLYFGLGDEKSAEMIKIRFPNGVELELKDLKAGKTYTVGLKGVQKKRCKRK
jgi:hypothetical protein